MLYFVVPELFKVEIVGFASKGALVCSPSSQHEGRSSAIQKGKGMEEGEELTEQF